MFSSYHAPVLVYTFISGKSLVKSQMFMVKSGSRFNPNFGWFNSVQSQFWVVQSEFWWVKPQGWLVKLYFCWLFQPVHRSTGPKRPSSRQAQDVHGVLHRDVTLAGGSWFLVLNWCGHLVGGWAYPSGKYEFVNWDGMMTFPINGKNVPNHQRHGPLVAQYTDMMWVLK